MANKTLTFDLLGRDRTASKTLRGVGKSVGVLNRQFTQLGGVVAGALSVRAIMNYGKESVNAYLEAEAAQTKLVDAYARFPALADTNIEDLRKLNKQQLLKTGYDDDAYAVAQATLAQYKLTGSQIKQLTPLVADYARKTGKDLPSAATTLGKALLGQGRALKDIGINFKNTGSVAGNFDSLMGSLQEKVGGFAESFGKTGAGKLEIIKARFNEIQEAIGGALMGVVAGIDDKTIDTAIAALERLTPVVAAGATQLGNFFDDWFDGYDIWLKESKNLGADLWNNFGIVPGDAPSPMADMMTQQLADAEELAATGGVQVSKAYVDGISTGLAGSTGAGSAMDQILLDAIASGKVVVGNPTGARYIGSMLVQGIADGINSSTAAEDAAAQMARKISNTTKFLLQIHSPSKVGMEIGGYFTQGVGLGVTGSIPALSRSVGSMVSGMSVAGSSSRPAGGDVHVHLSGMYAGDRMQLARTIQTVLRDGGKNGLPAGA